MGKIDAGQKIVGGLGKMLKAEKYVVPHSVNQRSYYDIHKVHRPQFESMLSDTLASGIPEDLINEIRFFGMNSPSTGGKAMWLPDQNGITLQEIEFSNRIADRGDRLREMQGWLTHEFGHAADLAGTPRQISNPKRGALSFIRDQDRMRPQHDVMDELVGLDKLNDTSVLGTHLAYPMLSGFKDDNLLASEVLAQLYRGWKGNPDVIMTEAPKTGRLLERAFKGDNVGDLRANIKNQFGFKHGGPVEGWC